MNTTDLQDRIQAIRPHQTTYIVWNLHTRAIKGIVATGETTERVVEVKYLIDGEPYIRATDVGSKFNISHHEVIKRTKSYKWPTWIRIYGKVPGKEPVVPSGVIIVPPLYVEGQPKRTRKRRACIIEGYRFESLADAAEFLEIKTWNVFDRINNKNFPEWQYE